MKKSPEKLIAYLEKFNKWRRGCAYQPQPHPKKVGDAIDQAVETLKTMNWQPFETAPHDRQFLGAWGSDEGKVQGYDVYQYIGNGLYESINTPDDRLPTKFYKIFAWLEIPKYAIGSNAK